MNCIQQTTMSTGSSGSDLAGSYHADAKVYDVVLATSAYSDSTHMPAHCAFGYDENHQYPTPALNKHYLEKAAEDSESFR